ncbi:hypothetical protein NYR55_05715 [Sphingomonas sp. BGYR3]|uniref:hypothetical protein n=1 Tax=Sphingomonas sp. BGYR3 TaxID=2975483 RepID=UPI0021A8BC61|nr:hypothetical protein [Sphingomonas sp. BGYR3]MDG5488116.1 hypothetical protein [Sphingomonas sp. BGYR3]
MFRAVKLLSATASAIIVAATFGAVAQARLPEPKPAPAVAKQDAVHTPKAKKGPRYCIDTESTGSRIVRRVCQTRDEWLPLGVDPLKL